MSDSYEDVLDDFKAQMATFGDSHSDVPASAPQVKAFQNLAITQINSLVSTIFGTVGVPPIPPVP